MFKMAIDRMVAKVLTAMFLIINLVKCEATDLSPMPWALQNTCTHEYLEDCSKIRECYLTVFGEIPNSGVYKIQPSTHPKEFYVYCDMDTDGGGWTVFQKRIDGAVDFYRRWTDYKNGFGNFNSEYWLGNDKLFYLTAQRDYEMRVDLESFSGDSKYARYSSFRLGDESNKYKLLLGHYSGTAGDSLDRHRGMNFTTKDRDYDLLTKGRNCAVVHSGAWWYKDCHTSNLNGLHDPQAGGSGIIWRTFYDDVIPLKTSEMKIRRT